MRKKLAAAALLASAWAAARSPAQPAGIPEQPPEARSSLRYTVAVEAGDPAEAAQRLELRALGWRLLALSRGAGLRPDSLSFGLECPWGAAGPLAPRGLLRALADPLGYSPGSEVFSEPTGFRLEGALWGSCRRGLWLEPFPGRLGLFALRRPTAPAPDCGPRGTVQAGGAAVFRWPCPDRLAGRGRARPGSRPSRQACAEVQALALLTLPASGGHASGEWLLERAPFPGGGLLHLGSGLLLESARGRLACRLVAAASGGQRVPAGLLGLCRLEASGGPAGRKAGAWSIQGLLGGCTQDYRLPEGELYPGAWAAGLRLEARPTPALRLAGGWRRRVDRPPPAPVGFLPGTEEGELTAWLEVPLDAGGRLEARAQAGTRVKYAADGEEERSAAADLELTLGGPPGRLELELHGAWQEEGIGLRGRMGAERRGVRVQAGAEGLPKAGKAAGGLCWRPVGRLELSGEDFLFWLSAGTGDGGRELSLGWSARQALRKSPTLRTSRCRR